MVYSKGKWGNKDEVLPTYARQAEERFKKKLKLIGHSLTKWQNVLGLLALL